MKFVDEVTLEVHSGKGGDGCIAFRREKYRPMGGPSGGDGGRGGSVILRADPQLATLLDYKFMRIVRADNGRPGEGSDCYGAAGEDVVLPVPVGTLVYDAETDEPLGDLDRPGAELVAARGGKGGRGNIHFKSSTQQAPRKAEPGEPAESRRLRLELKLLADVGVVGYPNTGKSTLISRMSRARPKIADYPFTTLVPTLGVVAVGDHDGFVMADVPGLIEGASEGAGLGHRFLRHVERCRVLVELTCLLPGDPPEPEAMLDKLDVLEREMARYSPELAAKPRLVGVSKLDLPEVQAALPGFKAALAARGQEGEVVAFSAVTGQGLPELLGAIHAMLQAHERQPGPADQD
ncbi:MAG TPA: GTPase ObgE [Myxococcota bacterium]|nr:GTPase ObgE [Myxococcota bacterium]HRY95039.1 GTPase ObgE [Myxococcota bacterium]HSA21090.1 GTPase ObgE [Myxococcota bacterium]